MEINDALHSYLKGYAGLTVLISTRVYPDTLPQAPAYPAITFQQISEEEVESFTTPNSNMIGATYQFSCWASTRASAQAVAKQLRLAFKNYSGVMGGAGGVTVSGVEKISKTDDIFNDSDGRIIAYRTSIDFQIWYQE